MRLRPTAFLLLAVILTACLPASAPAPSGLRVIAIESFLADIAQNVAGERLRVETLLPIGADPHGYQPTPQDAAKLSEADVIILNGAGYESFLGPLLENAAAGAVIVEASAGLKSRNTAAPDPHFWLDPNNVMRYVENIHEGLSRVDPEGAAVYAANATAYMKQLQELDTWIVAQTAQIPPEQRLLVTNHEALGYFADRYGYKIAGSVIPGMSTEAAPSAQQVAALIDKIKGSGVKAIFLSGAESPALADQIAAETGVQVVNDLYLESLSRGAPAGTYVDMMKHNVTRIVEALK